jgi:hypothetical protein
MQLIKTCNKGWHMNCLENFYFQQYQLQGPFIRVDEQIICEINPLFAFIHDLTLNMQARRYYTPSKQQLQVSYPSTGPNRPLGLQVAGAPRISRQSAHKGGYVVSPKHRPPLPPQEIFLVLISVRG